jgi:predicted small secreted protein
MKMKRTILIVVLLAVVPALSGCWYVVAGGAGAYGGYKMKQKGYTLQSPITKEKSSQPSK